MAAPERKVKKKKSKAVERLKEQDRKLALLPSVEDEKRKFSRGESILRRLIVKRKVNVKSPGIPDESRSGKGAVKKKRKSGAERQGKKR